jgi:hypothetical protein
VADPLTAFLVAHLLSLQVVVGLALDTVKEINVAVLVDVLCWECKVIKEDVLQREGKIPEIKCPECGELMTKKVDFGSFELKYNNKTDMCDWTGETSQYWKAFKDAKARGENVKPADED